MKLKGDIVANVVLVMHSVVSVPLSHFTLSMLNDMVTEPP